MAVFEVRAMSASGEDAEGWVRANDIEDCNSKVLAKGFYITAVRILNPWKPRIMPGRLNSGRIESVIFWIQSFFGRRLG